MQKVGILTYQFADNYGAVIQCYSLYKYLNKIQGIEAEIINYIPPNHSYVKYWRTQKERIAYEKKRELFMQFLFEKCKLQNRFFCDISDVDEYDSIIVGSDQVWNTVQNYNKGYFLPKVSDKIKKIAYSASLGICESSPYINREYFRNYVSKFDHISVRELEHVELLEKITGKRCLCTLDPTLLLSGNDYKSLLRPLKTDIIKTIGNREYVFFFWLNNDDSLMRGISYLNKILRNEKLIVVHSIPNEQKWFFSTESICMFYEGVENFLWYIYHAKYIITNSYHGTIFSIIFKKNFYTFQVETMRSRIETLSKIFDIKGRISNSTSILKLDYENIDYEEIYKKWEYERARSEEYLINSILM